MKFCLLTWIFNYDVKVGQSNQLLAFEINE